MAGLLEDRRILIVEDDFVVALDMSEIIAELGGTVIGPAGQLAEGLALAESEELSGAILDINLGSENSFALADRLLARGVPLIFVTGYGATMLPKRFAAIPTLSKPFSSLAVERALHQI
jgi:CheY-like chemotaxis protein